MGRGGKGHEGGVTIGRKGRGTKEEWQWEGARRSDYRKRRGGA